MVLERSKQYSGIFGQLYMVSKWLSMNIRMDIVSIKVGADDGVVGWLRTVQDGMRTAHYKDPGSSWTAYQ